MKIGDGSITYTKTKEDNLIGLRPEVYYSNITVTTDEDGFAQITSGNLPIGYYNYNYIITFFNGTNDGFLYYIKVTDYNGVPVANQQVTFTLLYIPNILNIAQQGM